MAKDKGTEIPINGVNDEKAMDEDMNEKNEAMETEDQELSLSEEELVALCREHVCPHCDVMKEAEGEKLRALADSENVKKRLHREAEDLKRFVGESILADLLPVLDNLDLALMHADQADDACKNFIMGVDMTRKIFVDTVKRHGLERVEPSRGEAFNPEFHEAVGMAQEASLDDNCVVQVAQNGYILKGRLLRPAKVMVNKKS
ncbi:nucleotide exchange factor GrpE [Salidesulfovibrio onnuriiensis]|uniref:nucleotide exchange factor GrpE n=1 Tax=Salidesulfovibrio onnuriiensis TaxID=2583823 RepID=UPI0011C71B35|nr:nucleotide exchange factor GrpE [Salidesulfovibrio onnuriiensis]